MSSCSKWSSHPTQLSSVAGQVVVLYSQSGVVVVAGPTQIYCFFTRAQVWDEGNCSIRVGEEVMINARLVPSDHRNEMVPYLATTVWREGCQLPSALSLRLLSPHTQEELQQYQDTVTGLVSLLPDSREDKLGGVEVDRMGSSLVMQGIFACQGVREKEGVKSSKSVKAKQEQYSETTFKVDEEPKKRKKRCKSSTSEEEPVKHLDCLHKINDIIAELEKKVATDPPKMTQSSKPDPSAQPQPEVISYPQPGVAYSLNRPTSPHNIGFPYPNRSSAPAWLGLTVAPGSVSTAINPVSNPLVPSKEQQAAIEDTSDEEDQSPIKKSLFTNIFEHDDRAMSPDNRILPRVAVAGSKRSDIRGELGNKLSNLMQDRILGKTRGRESGSRGRKEEVGNSREKTTSQSRSNSRERRGRKNFARRTRSRSITQGEDIAKRKLHKNRSRSRSRNKGQNKRKRSRSTSSFSEKKNYKSRSRSRSRKGEKNKYIKFKSGRSKFEEKTKRRKSRSRSISGAKEKFEDNRKSRSRSVFSKKYKSLRKSSRSRSKIQDRRNNKKNKGSRSPSPGSRRKRRSSSSCNIKKDKCKVKTKSSHSPKKKNKRQRSNSRQRDLKIKGLTKKTRKEKSKTPEVNEANNMRRKSLKNRKDEKDQGDDLRNYIEKLKTNDGEKEKPDLNLNTMKSDDDSDASEDEMIIQRRRLNRSKFLAAFKDENKKELEVNCNERMDKGNDESIPIAFFEQPDESLEVEDDNSLPVVYFDAEVLYDVTKTHVLQLGAHASVSGKTFTFFKYMQPSLLETSQLEQLNTVAKLELMDNLRLKTSKFDVTPSGTLNIYFKHPDLGSTIAEKEKEVLLSFISFLGSVKAGKPVILVTHRKDTVLPALFSLLTKHDLLPQFSALVSQCCELVHLAWELHMDHLWQGARYPGLRSVAEFVDKDFQWEDGYLPCDKISFLLAWIVGKIREEHKLIDMDRFVEKCGGAGVMDYMTVKYNLVQTARGDDMEVVVRPGYVEVVRGSDQWGKKMRIDLKWKENEVCTDERNNRRTPLPEPDSQLNDGEHHIRILKPAVSSKGSVGVRSWSEKSYNTYLPPGVSKVSPLSTSSLLLRIPALKPRISELLGVSVLIQQNQEFTHCRILKSTEVLTQPKNSMFPIVEAMFENCSKEEITLDSKIINFAVANIKIDSRYET